MSVLITNDKPHGLLMANGSGADYLFHQHEAQDYDIGDKTIQCGRKADGMKLWLYWKSVGYEGLRYRAEYCFDMLQYALARVKELEKTGNFKLVAEPSWLNLNFWYIPDDFKGLKIEDNYEKFKKMCNYIYLQSQRRGKILVNHSPLSNPKIPNFFRLTIPSPKIIKEDVDFLFNEIHEIGKDLKQSDF